MLIICLAAEFWSTLCIWHDFDIQSVVSTRQQEEQEFLLIYAKQLTDKGKTVIATYEKLSLSDLPIVTYYHVAVAGI